MPRNITSSKTAHRLTGVWILAALLAFSPAAVLAQNSGHGPYGTGTAGNFGGKSAVRSSDQGLANTNGPNAAARSFGLDRAHLRMNQQGIDHSKALQSPGHSLTGPGNSASAPGHNK